jgi:intracellular sulfur oxidation DsrE/DsrF family protein
MNGSLGKVAAATALALAAGCASTGNGGEGSKVVYHINEGVAKATPVLGNVKNHLNADPKARIVVVAHGPGIDFLLDGAKDKNGNPFDVSVDTLQEKGVEFRVCNNTLVSRKIDRKLVIPQARIVPSGVAEVARLQAEERYAYVKP